MLFCLLFGLHFVVDYEGLNLLDCFGGILSFFRLFSCNFLVIPFRFLPTLRESSLHRFVVEMLESKLVHSGGPGTIVIVQIFPISSCTPRVR